MSSHLTLERPNSPWSDVMDVLDTIVTHAPVRVSVIREDTGRDEKIWWLMNRLRRRDLIERTPDGWVPTTSGCRALEKWQSS